MKCENCHVNEATVFLTQSENGQTTEVHLCDTCAKESENIVLDNGISFQQFLSGLLESNKSPQVKSHVPTCTQCGMTIEAFKKNSLVGCANCYKSFDGYLQPIIKRLQSNIVHTGKRPSHVDTTVKKIQEQISRYESELKVSLMEEDYERAAILRDKIRELKGDGIL